MQELYNSRQQNRTPSQLKIYQSFLNLHSIQYPNVSQLLLILIATPANTSPVEAGYTLLEIICAKHRNRPNAENVEAIFILANLKLNIKDPMEYEKEIERLEKQ